MSDTTDDRDPEELLEQSKEQKRHQSEPQQQDTEPDAPSLEEYIADVYEELDAGEVPTNLTMRDRNLAALIRGLDEAGQLDAVGADVREYLDRDATDSESRGSVLGLLVRAGLAEVRPDLIEAGEDGYETFTERQETQF
ncbi:hypothetical protein BDK61_4744 [Haloarcula quadrata]|uniref:DUF8115 domain-containing protein n=4 Tax=Haloarcula TaxID=2237 RepID=Q5V7T9_HALMA|nr:MULTISPECIES: hypothetical protein [Haloarcula]AAV44389.1 unknown [Haloarcula marismortui ATCC 43049]EMA09750.1 hypothetical protein C436_18821 [Haloarcula sinaiiensis ATCC 33800]EMA14955.1 hypothetical protein C435_14942 [Haloarcula californiae ATCC 33799]NHN63654.1 hypothetical protein [Haloarcula sp. JP-Z28]QUJ74702.1 hypothetical protein KDQ40_21075 [Haloarcula sinaiiensis ATCC 33800]